MGVWFSEEDAAEAVCSTAAACAVVVFSSQALSTGTLSFMNDDLVVLWGVSDQVEVGKRLREARRRRNLTQEELGRDIASVGYVSRLEAGARRGDLDLFAALADRLGIDVRELLADRREVADDSRVRLQIDYGELALASGDAVEAERWVADLSDDTEGNARGMSEDLSRALRRVRVGAYEAQGRLPAAIAEGEILTRGERRDLDWIGDLIALSRCYREAGEIGRAITVGTQAADEIERVGLGGTTEAIQLVLSVAAAHSDRGDLVYASQLCREAIARADELKSPVALASAYWNASVFEFEQGRVAAAVPLARRALGEFEKADDARNIGRLRGTLGVLLTQVDPPELSESIEVLQQSRRELEASSAGRYDLARSAWALASAYFHHGDRELAERWLDEAVGLVDDGAPLVLASVRALQGEVAYADGMVDEARGHYRDAVHTLTGIGSDRAAGHIWYQLAELLETAGDTEGALTAFKSAAASVGFANRGAGRNTRVDVPADPA